MTDEREFHEEEIHALEQLFTQSEEYFEQLSANALTPAISALGASADDPHLQGNVSHYEIVEKIGGGGMGVVYKARDSRLGRAVALKFLPPVHSADPSAHRRLLAEAQAASALDHPNIGVVYEIGEAEGKPFIAMAWYDGQTVRDLLRRESIDTDTAVNIALQVCSALAAAHSAGIIHRDVKPANVIVTGSGVAKLVDFGIARTGAADEADPLSFAGTPAYMSPEQTTRGAVDARSDLWSLGVMLYEMLAGQKPFRGNSATSIIDALQSETPAPLPDIDPDVPARLAAIVHRLLEKRPEHRFQSADEVAAALRSHATEASKPPTQDATAHELYLKGRSAWSERTRPKIEEAIAFYRGALERDPDFALAHSAMGEAYVNMSNFEYMPADAALSRAGIAADRAIMLDDSLAEAHSTRGFVLASRGRFGESEDAFIIATELKPRYVWARHYYALLLIMLDRTEEAQVQLERAIAIDPLTLPSNATLAIVHGMRGRLDAARDQYAHTLALSPRFPLTRYYHGTFEAGQERYTDAVESLEIALESAPAFPGVRASLACCYLKTGRVEASASLMRELEQHVSTRRSKINLALGMAVMNKLDAAFEMLEAETLDVPTTIEMRANPLLRSFREDPRYESLLQSAGLS